MAQVADYNIANANGATVRADINAVFLAVSSTNSGTSEPSTMYAFMLWVDTTTNLIKLRNAANGAWITLGLSVTASNTVDINGGAIDGTAIGASSASTGAFTTLAATGASDLDSSVIINDSGADVDFRVESDDYGHMLFVDGGNNRVGICGSVILPTSILEVSEAVAASSGINSLVTISATDGGVNMGGGEGPGILFKIPDDETNPSVGAQIGAFKESSDDSVSNTGLAFSVSQNDETLDEAMRIRSTGDVAIGTEGYDGQRLAINCGTADTIFYGESTDANCFGSFRDDSSTMDIQYGAIGNDHVFRADTTVRARITGDGLCFGTDTAAANALDDYEEGTWTPSIVGTTGTAGTHAMSASGAGNNYTKIGNRVYFHMSRYVTNKGSYTGKTSVSGLPFTNNGSTTALTLALFPDSSYPDTRMVVAQTAGTTLVQFYDGPKADLQHDWSDLVTGYYLTCAGTYLTDS